jgi:hypothetical protein
MECSSLLDHRRILFRGRLKTKALALQVILAFPLYRISTPFLLDVVASKSCISIEDYPHDNPGTRNDP